MMPEHEVRRAIIREWMSFPKEKRQREEQAASFATKVTARLTSIQNPHQRIMRWLLPRSRQIMKCHALRREQAIVVRAGRSSVTQRR